MQTWLVCSAVEAAAAVWRAWDGAHRGGGRPPRRTIGARAQQPPTSYSCAAVGLAEVVQDQERLPQPMPPACGMSVLNVGHSTAALLRACAAGRGC